MMDERIDTHGQHRGSVYVAVLGTVTLIVIVVLAGMTVVRIQRRAAHGNNDSAAARNHAHAAVDLGAQLIRQDPFWRTNYTNGDWITNQAVGQGKLSVNVIDPVDGDLSNSYDDPVVITGTGVQGEARVITSIQMEVTRGLPSLEVAMLSGHNLMVDSSTINGDQRICANNDIDAKNGAHVYGDAEAVHHVKGGTYHGIALANQPERMLPDVDTVMDYYLANGTNISHASLYSPFDGLLTNPGFEVDTDPWFATNGPATLTRVIDMKNSGVASLLVSDRGSKHAGPAYDITSLIENGSTYDISFYTRAHGNDNIDSVKAQVEITYLPEDSSVPEVISKGMSPQQAEPNQWTELTGQDTYAWTGTLQSAVLRICTTSGTGAFYVDDVRFTPASVSADDERYLRQTLLSPQHNPFGTGETNNEGIYIIDCGGKDIIIEDCRIVGTLVLINPGGQSVVQGSVCWEPARNNYPALLTSKDLTIATSSAGLSEADINVNLNPPGSSGTPYPYPLGTANGDMQDAYPSRIRGLVYSREKLKFENAPIIAGTVLTNGDIELRDAVLTLNYKVVHLHDPPPGFEPEAEGR